MAKIRRDRHGQGRRRYLASRSLLDLTTVRVMLDPHPVSFETSLMVAALGEQPAFAG